ncbi:16S rRNA (cytosine(1402)-N(4))-methyltransferase [Candidatus Gottesmanbacteria bacterium RIFCSPHIGHO2_01_FULL_46_14]|uniref:Ribosomal RNA small subunit methyltransferase H n=2 Tax=Candidatus Gottesmaniibacteriota TaxID=1752720 RepID=A0A1F5ZNM2_9BACT|nr:MAG: 16S rRNA (cytosine(1402)-N(4))-methyltransferase [Candidatus Gottesmanbacteria bacterium RIFCSPHIGHO2_01_FULL_46_14]OGG28832.1 MAG: 16S rRNA (cytosine(1402)-N(4))-methyltransferase [Candidatus Gottesmanbacteria bacterium RIFCSPLOWO2_01_FULL_46_21]
MTGHVPVLLKEVADGLNVRPGGKYIDATFGAGGHSAEIVKRGGMVLGIDADPEVNAVHGNFRDIEKIAKENGFESVDGILFDLGVSSMQLDSPERGFSYRFNGPLDLRLDPTKGEPASQIVNTYSEGELYEIFTRFGEENNARTIARAIVIARAVERITTTEALVKIVGNAKPVLSRIFQALRIEVNDELGALRQGLDGARIVIKTGGRLVVISFHSLEDRIVKQYMRNGDWKILTKKPITATDSEVRTNTRARSAKMRVAQRL